MPAPLQALLRRFSEDELARLMLDKLLFDVRESPLRPDVNLEKARNTSLATLRAAAVIPPTDKRIPSNPILTFSEGAWKGLPPPECIQRLQEMGRPIEVSCSCVEVAASATIKAMSDLFEVNVVANSSDPNGYAQVRSVAEDDSIDFVIAPNAPFFLAGMPRLERTFRMLFPVHGELQYVFRRRGTLWSEVKRIHVLPQSSAEEQVLGERHTPRGESPKIEMPEITAATIPNLLLDLDRPDSVLVWEPLASALRRHPEVEREEESVFRLWISLFSHRRWQHARMRNQLRAFQEVFLASWIRCASEPQYAVGLLARDAEFRQSFAVACEQSPAA